MVRVAVGLAVAVTVGVASATAGSAAATPCASTVQGELMTIIHRVYDQALSGQDERAAVRRIGRSTTLASAVATGRPAAVRAALMPLLKNQIIRIQVAKGNATLARIGSAPSYAPVRGPITRNGRVVGRFVLAVSTDASFVSEINTLSGATVRFARGGGRPAQSFPATTYPSGSANVVVSLPHPSSSLCGATPADTRLETIAFVARNVMNSEGHSQPVTKTLGYVEGNAAFRTAVAAGNPAAVRAAIIGFFRNSRFHIVRVRAWKGNQLINDVGGPFVLSPAAGVIRNGAGMVVGRFLVAVQDDLGFIKLVHSFTGADVVLHTDSGTVPGSNLTPGPSYTAGLSTTTYGGRRYRAFGFTGTAFPAGTLRVSLLEGQ